MSIDVFGKSLNERYRLRPISSKKRPSLNDPIVGVAQVESLNVNTALNAYDANKRRIVQLGEPSNSLDAVTKLYVDSELNTIKKTLNEKTKNVVQESVFNVEIVKLNELISSHNLNQESKFQEKINSLNKLITDKASNKDEQILFKDEIDETLNKKLKTEIDKVSELFNQKINNMDMLETWRKELKIMNDILNEKINKCVDVEVFQKDINTIKNEIDKINKPEKVDYFKIYQHIFNIIEMNKKSYKKLIDEKFEEMDNKLQKNMENLKNEMMDKFYENKSKDSSKLVPVPHEISAIPSIESELREQIDYLSKLEPKNKNE